MISEADGMRDSWGVVEEGMMTGSVRESTADWAISFSPVACWIARLFRHKLGIVVVLRNQVSAGLLQLLEKTGRKWIINTEKASKREEGSLK
ncbi:MAG: hypothetical protein ACFFGZ_15405 [Candidatus Thorarchaeota archaeon]